MPNLLITLMQYGNPEPILHEQRTHMIPDEIKAKPEDLFGQQRHDSLREPRVYLQSGFLLLKTTILVWFRKGHI